ncbi:hypothetical protein ACA910_003051 [Epithemia clementina (nom. ined.)]
MALSSTNSGAPASSSSTVDDSTVNLMDLAAAAIACTVSASRAIMKIADPEDDEGKNTRTKNDGSFVTDADIAAQFIIVQALRTVSRSVKIVGEESEEEMERLTREYAFLDQDILSKTKEELNIRRKWRTAEDFPLSFQGQLPLARKQALDPSDESELLFYSPTASDVKSGQDEVPTVVDVSRVCIVVDPLDGTKSYAKGEYDAVSILIGIILDNKPCFGVIGKPFGYFNLTPILDTDCVTIYGGTLLDGVFVAGGEQVVATPIARSGEGQSVAKEDMPRAVISSSRSKGIVHDFCLHLGQQGLVYPEPLLISGAGEKSLRLILQQNNEAIWFYPKPGTSLWDVAAPDALLRSLGGKLTDKFGNEMDYSKSRDEFENMDGVVACIDKTLHAQCIQLFQEGDWPEQG